MKKAPLPAQEQERLQALYDYNVLDTPKEEAFDDLTRLAAQICKAPIALIGFVDSDRYWIKSSIGVSIKEMPRGDSFAAYTILSTEPLLVEDATHDEQFNTLPPTQSSPPIRCYAGVPLHPPGRDYAIGTLCVMDHQARTISDQDLEALRILGHQIITQLELRRNFIELEVSIASHLRAEEALRQAEEKYRSIFENVMEGIFQTTPDGHYLSANPMLAKIYGFDTVEDLVVAVGDIQNQLYVQPGRREEFTRLIKQYGTVNRFESQVRRKDETIIWISEAAREVRDRNGDLLYYEGTVQDITERKWAEEALQDSELLYHSLVECLPQNIFRKDREGRFTFANRRFCEVVGLPLEEIVGKTDFDLFPQELASKYQKDDQQVMTTHHSVEVIEENRTKDRGTIHVQVVKTPLYDADGQVIGIQGIFWDVTERKKMEEALAYERDLLKALLDNLPDGIYFKDIHSHFIRVGRALTEKFGLSDPNDAVGKSDYDFFSREHAQAAFDDEQSIIQSGEPIVGLTEKETWASGTETWALTTKMPLYNRSGEIIGTFGVSKDITTLKRAEEALANARDIALDSARLKSEFLANMSHEIRTPMNCLIGMTDLLLDTDLTDEQIDFGRTIRDSAEALLTLINDILDFSKIEAGKLVIDELDFNLLETVESAVDMFEERAEVKGIQLVLFHDSETPTHLRGDPGRIRQVLTNLLGNAVKFTENGNVTLDVRCEEQTENVARIRFAVTDTGIGIAPNVQDQLFQAFTQADGSLSRRYGGTGLGLAISRQLVELMGGQIGLQSELGNGSTFFLTLPLRRQTEPAPTPQWTQALQKKRLLVADSSSKSREALCHYTQALGIETVVTLNPTEIIPELMTAERAGNPFDAVILDLQFPDMDGLSLAQEIRTEPSLQQTRIIILTSLSLRLDAAAWRTAGIDAYLVRPIKPSRLSESIAVALGQASETTLLHRNHRSNRSLPTAAGDKSIRILVAEDNPVNQKITLRQLKKLGYTSTVVQNGRAAVEATAKDFYPIILMDCQMPELDGYAATRLIREREAQAPPSNNLPPVHIIAMTANAMESNRDSCLAVGMNDYITKPVKLVELQAVLQSATGTPFADSGSPAPSSRVKPAESPAITSVVVDPAALDALRGLSEPGEKGMLEELIGLFLEDTPPHVLGIEEGIRDGNADQVRKAAHTLKGTSNNIGARNLARLCAEIEQFATLEKLSDAKPLLPALQEEFKQVCFVLEKEARK